MLPYEINRLLHDLNPKLLERLKQNDQSVYDEYRISPMVREALRKAVEKHEFKDLYDLGAQPNLLFRFGMMSGYDIHNFSNVMKK